MSALEKILRVLREDFGIADASGETALVELDIDSLEKAALFCELEEALGIDIPEDDAQKFFTLGEVARYAEAHCAA